LDGDRPVVALALMERIHEYDVRAIRMTRARAYADQYACQLHRSTGKERDAESGNDYFGARYYASSMGRWLSPDWSAQPKPVPYANLENPQSLNLYSYVLNNPLSHTDADGHECTVDGEKHGGLWCFAHALGLVETQHEKADDARNFFTNNLVTQNGHVIDPKKMNDQQVLQAFRKSEIRK
jgi:RHS repeat-associated protein